MPGCPINSVYRSLTGLRGGNGPNWEVMQRLFRNVITKPGNTAKTPRRRDLGRMVIQRASADMRMLLAGKKKIIGTPLMTSAGLRCHSNRC